MSVSVKIPCDDEIRVYVLVRLACVAVMNFSLNEEWDAFLYLTAHNSIQALLSSQSSL